MSRNDDLSYADHTENGITGFGGQTAPAREKTVGRIQPDGRPKDERGNYIDRRNPSLKSFIYGAFRPRRRRIQREEDRDRTFLDWHPRHLLIVCTAILTLSLIDGLLTVQLDGAGIKQINPILASIFSANAGAFALAKILFTAIGVSGLVVTAHMRIYNLVKASTVLYGFLAIYFGLVIYECYLAQGLHQV
jgi:hypothetical protein